MKEYFDKKTDWVDRYLRGELSATEKLSFERRLKEDPELAEQLEMQKEIGEAVLDEEALDFANTLENTYDIYQKERKSKRLHRPVYRMVGMAAMIVVLLGAGFLIKKHTGRLSVNQSIVAEFYQPYDVPVNYRSPEGTVDATFRKAVEKYNDKKYAVAIRLFEQVLKEDKTRMDANLMNGLSNFEIQRYNKADSSFSNIIKHRDNLFFQQAQWYLGFCFLMTNQHEKALKLYKRIIDEKGFYSLKAEKILKKLKSNHRDA